MPGLQAALPLLNDVTLRSTCPEARASKGNVTFLKNPNPVKGSIDVGFTISPFRATGRLRADAKLGPLDVIAGGGIAMRPGAFTAAGGASGKLRGVTLAAGRGVLSNRGIGVTGQLLLLPRVLGHRRGHGLEGLPGGALHREPTSTSS